MGLNTEASAALVFLILYTILLSILGFCYLTGRMRLRSRYTTILFHVTVRLAAQATGLAFGIVSYTHTSLLVAYFVLGAEGYFTLVLCAFRFLISWQQHNLDSRISWLEPRMPRGTSWIKRFRRSFVLFGPYRRPMAAIHHLLIFANVIIIVGGAQLAGDTAQQFIQNLPKARALRATGQSVFLTMNVFLLYCLIDTITQARREAPQKRIHLTLIILLMAWPLLFIRGVYGILAACYPPYNYFNLNNYTATGPDNQFVISEYILGTTMEWTSCALLMATYITSRKDPKNSELVALKQVQEGNKIDGLTP